MDPQECSQESASGNSTSGHRRHAMRLLRDESEEIVLVYELTGMRTTDPRMLVIESRGGQSVSRLEDYPANWRQLRDIELLALRSQDLVSR